MGERLNQNNAQEMTSGEARYSQLMDQYTDILQELNKWKIKFEVTVIPKGNSFEIDVVASNGVGKGVRKTLTFDQIMYMIDDQSNYANAISKEMLEAMLGKRAHEELFSKLSPAMQNVAKMSGKSSL